MIFAIIKISYLDIAGSGKDAFILINSVSQIFQLQQGDWRKPLSMGNQTSETHEQFRNQVPFVQEAKEFVPNPQGFVLNNHHTEGPSKVCDCRRTAYLQIHKANLPLSTTLVSFCRKWFQQRKIQN